MKAFSGGERAAGAAGERRRRYLIRGAMGMRMDPNDDLTDAAPAALEACRKVRLSFTTILVPCQR